MSREPYEVKHWSDSDYPRKIERHLDPDEIPEDIVRDLVREHVVRAECVHCGHQDVYAVPPTGKGDFDCLGPDCDHQLYLGDM